MNEKALSPVIAAIILIAVTITAAIAVAAWMDTISFTFMATTNPEDIAFSHSFSNQTKALQKLNVTIINTAYAYDENAYVKYYFFDEFLEQINFYNVSYVLTDWEPFGYPDYIKEGILYTVENYYVWFYVDFPNVRKVAITYFGAETAWVK